MTYRFDYESVCIDMCISLVKSRVWCLLDQVFYRQLIILPIEEL